MQNIDWNKEEDCNFVNNLTENYQNKKLCSFTWDCYVDDWANYAVCLNSYPPDPQSWFETLKEAQSELADFDEEDRKDLIILKLK